MNDQLKIESILGYVANDNPLRARKDGKVFEPLIPQPEWSEVILRRNGSVTDTANDMREVIKKYAWQTEKLAPYLRGNTKDQTCKKVWEFLFDHFKYMEDDKGKEQLRTPARSFAERRSRGIDCDDFTIFAGTILHNLNIPFNIRIARYPEVGHFQHVYNTIPQGSDSYLVIDGVLDRYDREKPPEETKDFLVMSKDNLNGIDISVLGNTDDDLANEISGILSGIDFEEVNTMEGLGNPVGEEELLGAIRKHLMRTRNIIARRPQIIADVQHPETFMGMLDYALKYWDTDKRDEALGYLESEENRMNELQGLGGYLESYEDVDLMYGLTSDGKYDLLGKAKAPKKFFAKVKQATQAVKKATQAVKQTVQKTTQNVKQNVKQATKNVAQKTQQVTKKAVQAVKKATKAIVRYSPITAGIRGAVLLAMKANALQTASKLKWGYLTQSEAQSMGFDMGEWQKVKASLARTENMFVNDLQGKAENLKNAILTGRAGGLAGEELSLGVAVATAAVASTAAATPFLTKILDLLKNINFSKLLANVKAMKLKRQEKKADLTVPTEEGGSAMPEGGEASDTPKETEVPPQEIPTQEEIPVEENSDSSSNESAYTDTTNTNSSDGENSSPSTEVTTSEDGKQIITASNSATTEENPNSSNTEESNPENLPTGARGGAPAPNTINTSVNMFTTAVDWVKKNPTTSIMIGAGAIFLIGYGLTAGGGKKETKQGFSGVKTKKRRKALKKKHTNVISGVGKKKSKNKKKSNNKKKHGKGKPGQFSKNRKHRKPLAKRIKL